jgi:hypothetical protein
VWFVSPTRGSARPPSSATMAVARRQTVRYLALLRQVSLTAPGDAAAGETAGTAQIPAVRAAAVHTSVIALYQGTLQRIAVWTLLPLSAAAMYVLTDTVMNQRDRPPSAVRVLAVAGSCLAFNALALVFTVVTDRPGLHALGAGAGATGGVVVLVATGGPGHLDPAAQTVVVLAVSPAVVYLASAPLAVAAYLVAVRLAWLVDPRARIVLGLLQCLHHVTVDTTWLHHRAPRRQLINSLDRMARTAQHDLPRLLPLSSSDPDTRRRIREQAHAIATQLRDCKRRVVLPSASDSDGLRAELTRLFVHACRDEWNEVGAPDPPARLPGRLERLAKRLAGTLFLVAAAYAVPALFGAQLSASAADNVRDVLLLSGMMCLVPLPQDLVNRIPDTFAGSLR